MYIYLAMFIWNAGTTWWITLSTIGGGISAVFANSLLMVIPFFVFRLTRRNIDDKIGYLAFICFWLTFEYIHLNWDLSWPWLTLGNGFAMYPDFVQWYELTGTLGGSAWILVINVAVYFWLREGKLFGPGKSSGAYIRLGLLLFAPIVYSLVLKSQVEIKTGKGVEIVAVQPNIDPYTDKFDESKYSSAVDQLIGLSEQKITKNTDYLIWPETALQGWCDYDGLEQVVWPDLCGKQPANFFVGGDYSKYKRIYSLLNKSPHLTLLTGIGAQKVFRGDEEVPQLAHDAGEFKWQSVNASAQLDTGNIEMYKKSKLVIGVEKIPYPVVFEPIIKLMDIQGAAHMGTQADREVFYNRDSVGVAPLICYESVYGEFIGEFVNNGAQLIIIMTNDGWWGNTEGHRHHKAYACLRAIELRRDIARSANTGISCFVNKKGEFSQATEYWEPGVIRGTLYPNDEITFYAKHGDYIGRLAYFLGLVLLFSGIVKRRTSRKSKAAKK